MQLYAQAAQKLNFKFMYSSRGASIQTKAGCHMYIVDSNRSDESPFDTLHSAKKGVRPKAWIKEGTSYRQSERSPTIKAEICTMDTCISHSPLAFLAQTGCSIDSHRIPKSCVQLKGPWHFNLQGNETLIGALHHRPEHVMHACQGVSGGKPSTPGFQKHLGAIHTCLLISGVNR